MASTTSAPATLLRRSPTAALFHFSRVGNNARLTCFNAATGAEQWTCEYPTEFEDMLGYNNGPRATPVVDGPHVYTFGAEGMLQCVRVADGQMVWRIDTIKEFSVVKNFFGVGSTPLVCGDLLHRQRRRQPARRPGRCVRRQRPSASRTARRSSRSTKPPAKSAGKPATTSPATPARSSPRSPAAMSCSCSPAAACWRSIRPKGETLAQFPWRARKLESVNASTPVVVGNEVFISETYELGSAVVRFTGSTFEEVWTDRDRRRNQAMALHWNTPIEHDGYLYGSSGYHAPEAELRCVEWKTGKVMWSEPNMGRSSLLLVDGKLVCLSEDGTLRLLRPNPQKYEELAKWELTADDGKPLLPYPAWAAPALSHGLLYVEGANRLVCLKLLNGE